MNIRPPKPKTMYFKIVENVGGPVFITLDGSHDTRESAERAIDKMRSNGRMRVAAYTTGDWRGPRMGEVFPSRMDMTCDRR